MIEGQNQQIRQGAAALPLPATTVIICSRNRPQLLIDVVESVLNGETVPGELIIIDQSDKINRALETLSTDRACSIHYVWSNEKGLSRANNQGIALATSELIAFTHDDVYVDPDWHTALMQALVEAGPRGVVTGQVRVGAEEVPGGFQLTQKVQQEGAVYKGRINKDVLYPLNMAMYRAAALEIGGFDVRLGPGTAYPAAEDNDFGFRLLEAGYKIIYVPKAIVEHRSFREEKTFLPLRWSYGLGRGAFYAKHLKLKGDTYILRRMVGDVKTHLVLFFVKFRHERTKALGDAVLAGGIIYGAFKWLMTQRKTS